ncbi:hypothetical protein ACFTS5_12895 [Nocardia sp. NPDC056952]|uniref:hypothetical protein n=1 Tax=Nocardia sp. NPDC056952 TaxID=3345979 RepID=UPI00363228CA
MTVADAGPTVPFSSGPLGTGPESEEDRENRFAALRERLQALEEQGRLAGISIEHSEQHLEGSGIPLFVVINLPKGKEFKPVPLNLGQWDKVPRLEGYRFVEGYEALWDTTDGTVWATLADVANGRNFENSEILAGIPGVEKIKLSTSNSWSNSLMPNPAEVDSYRLRVEGTEAALEITQVAPPLLTNGVTFLYQDYPYFLKIQPNAEFAREHAVQLLSGLARDFLFDLDVVHNLGAGLLTLQQTRAENIEVEPSVSEARFPNISYARQAHALYWYAMGATRFPLSQFLAYYQILEFYFSSFNRENVIQNIRRHMKNPSFAANNTAEINRLIDLTRDAHRGVRGERAQLLIALHACIGESSLRQILEQKSVKDELCAKKQKLKGVAALRLGEGDDIFEQVASRIYSIRCRIVHTKEGADGTEFDLLLPNDDESGNLGADIQLVRALAQHAMIHGGQER